MRKEKLTTIIICSIIGLFLLGYISLCVIGYLNGFYIIPTIALIVILIMFICVVNVLKERLKEIKEESKNDYSKY